MFDPAIEWTGFATDSFDGLGAHSVDQTPTLAVNDVSLNEGNSGTTSFDFTVDLSAPAGPGGVTFDVVTADDSATSPDDFASKSLTAQTIPEGSSAYTFSVLANALTERSPAPLAPALSVAV